MESEDAELEAYRGKEEGEADGAIRVFAKESHQKAEADKDHHMDVLEKGINLLHWLLSVGCQCIHGWVVLHEDAVHDDEEDLKRDQKHGEVVMVVNESHALVNSRKWLVAKLEAYGKNKAPNN